MATTDHDSSLDLSPGPVPLGASRSGGSSAGSGEIWLDGDVLACRCPDCNAPMSIRLWLMVADCWRCGASIELTEEQEQEALRLLREREASRRTETRQAAAAITPTMLRKAKPGPEPKPETAPPAEKSEPAPPAAKPAPKAPAPEPAPATPPRRRRRVAAAGVPYGTRARIRQLYEKGAVGVFWRDLFKDLPAWLVSLVFHLVAMLLLGLWVNEPPDDRETITLATSISSEDLEGGDVGDPEKSTEEAFEFDAPGAIDWDSLVDEESPGRAEVELEGVAIEAPDPLGTLPDFTDLTATVPAASLGRMFAGRDLEVRAQMVHTQGGTSFTEAAVARGLRWMARHQNADGSWSLHAFHKAPGAEGKGDGLGQLSDTAGTALALLPFLGAGQTHLEGEYSEAVFKGLKWLVEHQKENGDLRGQGIGRMYAHAQAAIVLCEAYALTGDEQLRQPAQLALSYIVEAQHSGGGWRYDPGQAGDTSVVGWQLMALRSGKMAYLYVPKRVFEGATRYLDRAQCDKVGGLYGYQPGRPATPVMTAEALLCRQYLGWPKDHPGLEAGAEYLLKNHLPEKDSPNIYYWYYATQVMHHLGGKPWQTWNAKVRQALVATQEKKGHAAGSWAPRGGFASRGGRIYMTSLSICTLEVYYRHMPLYSDVPVEGLETLNEPESE